MHTPLTSPGWGGAPTQLLQKAAMFTPGHMPGDGGEGEGEGEGEGGLVLHARLLSALTS